jgi:hypothetical protein
LAEALYDYFLSSIKLTHATVASGVFGALKTNSLTIISKKLKKLIYSRYNTAELFFWI